MSTSRITPEQLAIALGQPKRVGHEWQCLCPAHNDHDPSLSITVKGGQLLFICRAGCTQDEVIAQLKRLSLWYEPEKNRGRILATYPYTDKDGALLFEVVRLAPKDFRQRRADGTWKLDGVRRVPYRLPELAAGRATGNGHPWRVFICEGEKDADRLHQQWGVIATTNPGGAGKWRSEYNQHFTGSDAVILADNDPAGREHAHTVAEHLRSFATIVRIVEFPGLGDKEDISDWLDRGGTQSDLEDLLDGITPQPKPSSNQNGHTNPFKPQPWEHPQEPIRALDFVTLKDNPLVTREWVVPQWFPMLETTGLCGPGGEGKTLLAQMLGTAAALEKTWLELPVKQLKTALVLCEDRANDAHWRQADINRHYHCSMKDLDGLLKVYPRRNNKHNRLGIFDQDGELHLTTFFHQLLEDLRLFEAQLVVIDTRADVFKGNQNDEDHARTFVRQVCDHIAWELQGAVVLLYQPSKAGMQDKTGMSGSVQWDAAFRARAILGRPKPTDEDDEPDTDARIVELMKSNYSAAGAQLEVRWEDGVFVRDIPDEKPAYERASEHAAAERIWHEQFAKLTRLRRPLSTNDLSPNYAPRLIAKENRLDRGSPKCSERELRSVMEKMLARGAYRLEEFGPPSRRLAKIVKVLE